jgi:hypothetical protein
VIAVVGLKSNWTNDWATTVPVKVMMSVAVATTSLVIKNLCIVE